MRPSRGMGIISSKKVPKSAKKGPKVVCKTAKFVKGGEVTEALAKAARALRLRLNASGTSSGVGGMLSADTDIPLSERASLSPSIRKSGYLQKVDTPEGPRIISGTSPTEYGLQYSYKFKKGGVAKRKASKRR